MFAGLLQQHVPHLGWPPVKERPPLFSFQEYHMMQHELDQAVAAATGESVAEIAHRGFSIANPTEPDYDPDPWPRPPLIIDWDSIYPSDPHRF